MWRRSAIGSQASVAAAVDLHLAAGRLEQTIDEFQRGRFACAAAAEEHERLAALHREIDVAQERLAARQRVVHVRETR